MTTIFTSWPSPFCEILLVANDTGLTHIHLNTGQGKRKFIINPNWQQQPEAPILQKTIQQLNEYFAGKRRYFELPLNQTGTDFEKKVWLALHKIPFGETRSYQQIAEAVGSPKAARAVGMANSKNSLPLIVPCHRVVGSSGKLVGFAQGLEIKEKLLQMEAEYRKNFK